MASPAAAAAVAPATLADLIELLHKSGLFKPETLGEKLAEFELPPDAPGAAAALVRAGLLTTFQSRLLLAGKYRGFKLGTYLIRDQIGRGGMGQVYLAEHATLRRKVALKVLTADGAGQKAGVERFLREARAAAALDHPNIVRVFDVLQSGELHYIVMEYVEGKTLDALVQGGGAMAPGRAVAYISQAAAGLQHACEKGFVHRDIKPANLMVAKDGTVKILDMGLARSLDDAGDRVTEVLDEGAVVGTADFISPEQATNQPGVDIRADIYSLGATLFALVTGQPPFTGSTSQVLMQHQLKPAPCLTDHDRTIAPGLAAVVAKMLAKKPAERYATPAEVIAALAPWLPNRDGAQKVMAGLSSSELGRHSGTLQNTLDQVLSGSTRNLPKTAAARPKVPPAVLGGVVTAGLLLLGGVGYALIGGGSAKPDSAVAARPPAAGPATSPADATVAGGSPVKPAARPAATRPAATKTKTGRTVYALNLADQKPVSLRGLSERVDDPAEDIRLIPTTRTGDGTFPAGWRGSSYGPAADAEFFTALKAARSAIGVRNHVDKTAMLFTPRVSFAGKTARVRFTYLTDAGEGGFVFKYKPTQPAATAWELLSNSLPDPLPGTNGQWQTRELDVDLKDSAAGYFEFHSNDGDPSRGLYVSEFEVFDPHAAAAAGKPVLFRFDAGSLPEFRVGLAQNRADGELPAGLPVDYFVGCWQAGATGEFLRTILDGQPAVGLASRTGEASAQFVMGLNSDEFVPDQEYLLRVVYQTRGNVGGVVLVQHIENNYGSLGEVRFVPAAGWQTAEVKIKRPAGGTIKVAFQSSRVSAATTDVAYVRSIELLDPAAAKPLFRLDPADIQTFRHTAKDRRLLSGTTATFPAGTGLMAWKPESEAEFANEPVDGRPALSLTNPSGPVSAQFMLNLESPDHGMGLTLEPGKGYELRFEYKTVGGAAARVYTQSADYKTTGEQTQAPTTGGEWRPFAVPFTRGSFPLRLLIDLEGGGAGKTLYLGAIEVVEAGVAPAAPAAVTRAPAKPVAPAAPVPAARGEKVFALDLAGLPTFRGRFADGKADGEFPTGVPGLGWYTWKKESAAEFRGEPTDKGPALGVTNLNDEVSSQFNLGLEEAAGEAGLKGGRKYVLRVEYKTSNDAAGGLQVRTPDYAVVGRTDLPGTGGGWKWAELAFARTEEQKLHAIIENTAVGEGNTLWLRAATLHEAR